MDQIAEMDLEVKLSYSRSWSDLGKYVRTVDPDASASTPANICILTQDIFGPVRNAGIGTAYMHAAHFWAEAGHKVTIVYTQGRTSQNRTIEYWIGFYKERGIEFVCAPETPAVRAPTPALRWSYQGYRALRQLPPFDFVHSSECGASPYYSLMAKQNSGEFGETIFCIKTSSPHLWSRQGNEASILLNTGMVICAAERYCVENADLIISPSEHMLEWMGNHGYRLPKHVCVQPNVMPISAMKEASPPDNKARKINEIVFFGRLEPRKGLQLFGEALHLLHQDGMRNCRVTFLGKKIDDFNFDEFLANLKRDLPFKFRAIHNYNATQAVAFLGEPDRLAVIPSLLDNSPFTVYESLTNNLLFIAADVGGVPELVHPDDRQDVLFLPRPRPLARALARILKSGARSARLSFVPAESLKIWDRFHRQPHRALLANSGQGERLPRSRASWREVVFRSDTPYPLSIDELTDLVDQAPEKYIVVRSDQSQLLPSEKSELVGFAERMGADVTVPATTNEGPTPTTLVNFEPSVWTKPEFSYIETPIAVIKVYALRAILKEFAAFKSHHATNLDLIMAIASRTSHTIRVIPAPFGSYAGAQERRVSRGQRARHTEYLAAGLPSDIGNLLRIYGGLIDERSRLLAAQPILKNVERSLKLLRRIEDRLGPEGISKAAAHDHAEADDHEGDQEWWDRKMRTAGNRYFPPVKWARLFIPRLLARLSPARKLHRK